MNTLLRSIQKHQLLYALLFVTFYQVLCALQGFDLSDEGWGMYFYQQIFKNPECVVGQMPYWVTGVIGGVWNLLFPMSGFFGTRILGIIMVTGTFYLSYRFLKKSINSGWLLIGLIAQIMIVAGDPKPYGYNSLTAFFVLLTVIFFWRGLESNKSIWLYIGGLLLGINIFVRIPNLAILPIILIIPCYFYWKTGNMQIFKSPLWIAVAGVITGFGIIVLAMYYWGYWPLFMKALTEVANIASDDSNSHQLGRLLIRYLKNYWGIIAVGGLVTALGCIYVWLRSLISKKLSWILNLLVICILVFGSIHYNKVLRHNDMYFAHFISYIGIFLIFINYNKSKNLHLQYAALASLFMIICMPLGSDLGINTMWTSAWLALPLGTAYLYNLFRGEQSGIFKNKKNLLNSQFVRTYYSLVFLTYIGCGIYKNDNLAYYDLGPRFEKVHSINNPYCRLIFANSYRADLMNELLPVLETYVKPNDELLVYNFMPGLNYMTDTRCYISNAWLWCISGAELTRQLKSAMLEKKTLPVVLRQHFVATNRWQPYDPHYADADRIPINPLSRPDQTKAINDFLKENNYKTVWSNLNFEILLPEDQLIKR